MPKVALPAFPISALFAVNKPSGPSSMAVINDIKALISGSPLFVDAETLAKQGSGKAKSRRGKRGSNTVKIGQGGTLDPLADGVLVVGVGKGTKRLGEFLDCVKEYQTTCLLGCETDTYDSEGAQVRTAPWRHVTREKVEEALEGFRGPIQQAPPIFSALKMNGMPLYEYARKGIPLPRPIEARAVTVHALELVAWAGSAHAHRWPARRLPDAERAALAAALRGVDAGATVTDDPAAEPDAEKVPAAFVLRMRVSGGTYVRSIVHDLGHVLGSAAHVVTLTRSRQSRFALDPDEEGDRGCVPWDVFARAVEDHGEADGEGRYEWEREVVAKMEVVEGKKA